ncbi:hypothetical protein D3C81_969380 [compost metagenome]
MHLDTGPLEHRLVVVPGRIADPHLRGREVALEQIGADLQRAGAADGLDGGDATRLDRLVVGAKQQVLHRGAVVGGPFHRLIGARRRRGGALGFGLLHRGQQRNAALLVVIEADPQVHLLLAGVFVEGFDERQYGVASIGIDVFKHGGSLKLTVQFRRPGAGAVIMA